MHDTDRQGREVDTVDLDVAYQRGPSERASRRVPLVVAAIAVVVLAAGAFWFSSDDGDGDVEVAVDEEEQADVTTTTSPDVVAPTPIVLGAPDDGKDSVGLPVAADPSTSLVDGQTVEVTGSGFPPGESIGVVMCTREAGAEHGGRGVDACNIGHFGQGTSDEQGNVTVHFDVRRLVVLDGEEVDCASEPGRCILGMGMISDYDQSGGVEVSFDPEAPLPEAPTAALARTDDIADGETVSLRVTGLIAGSMASVELCSEAETGCTPIGQFEADAEGTFEEDVRLWRAFGAWFDPTLGGSPNVDCAREACAVQVYAETPGNRQIPRAPVSFDENRGRRTAPVLQLLDEGPFADGDEIELTVDGAGDAYYDVMLCQDGADQSFGGCLPISGGQYREGDTITARLDLASMGLEDPCQSGCVISTSLYPDHMGPDGSSQGPPPLFPEPVPIAITG